MSKHIHEDCNRIHAQLFLPMNDLELLIDQIPADHPRMDALFLALTNIQSARSIMKHINRQERQRTRQTK